MANEIEADPEVVLLDNPHPGILLRDDFLEPHGITPYRLAKATGLSQGHVAELLKGKRNFTPDTAIRIGAAIGTSAEMWINLQARHDLIDARRKQASRSIHVKRLIETDTTATASAT